MSTMTIIDANVLVQRIAIATLALSCHHCTTQSCFHRERIHNESPVQQKLNLKCSSQEMKIMEMIENNWKK
jgi:hypothetical protein